MTDAARLARLQQLAEMKRDHDMARLNRLSTACDTTRDKVEKLAQPLPLTEDPSLFAARQSHLAWATAQRMQLNVTLATQRAHMIEQREKTARSFGRAEALQKLRDRLARKGSR